MSSVYAANETTVSEYWQAYDPATGLPSTAAIAHDAAGLTLAYVPERGARVAAVTAGSPAPAALAEDDSAHTPWGFRHVGGGLHRIDWPDGAQAAGPRTVYKQAYVAGGSVVLMPAPITSLTGSNPRAAQPALAVEDGVVEANVTAMADAVVAEIARRGFLAMHYAEGFGVRRSESPPRMQLLTPGESEPTDVPIDTATNRPTITAAGALAETP